MKGTNLKGQNLGNHLFVHHGGANQLFIFYYTYSITPPSSANNKIAWISVAHASYNNIHSCSAGPLGFV